MSESRAAIAEAIVTGLRETPLTNMPRLLRHAGVEIPDEVGGNCIFVCQRVAKLLEPFGEVKFLNPEIKSDSGALQPSKHWAILLDTGDDELIICPSTGLTGQPISVKAMRDGGWDPRVFEAFPIVGGVPSHNVATTHGSYIAVTTRVRRLQSHQDLNTYFYNLDEAVEASAMPDPNSMEQGLGSVEKIYWQVLMDSGIVHVDVRKNRPLQLMRVGDGFGWKRWIYKRDKIGFRKRLQAILDERFPGQEAEQLIEWLQQARETRRRLKLELLSE